MRAAGDQWNAGERMKRRRTRHALALWVALALFTPLQAAAQDQEPGEQTQLTDLERADLGALVSLVNATNAGAEPPLPPTVSITWEASDFVRGQAGSTYIPFRFRVDRGELPSEDAVIYVRAVDKAAAPPQLPLQGRGRGRGARVADDIQPQYAWDYADFLTLPRSGRVSRSMTLPPGEYDLWVAVKGRTSDAASAANEPIGLVRRDLSVPGFTDEDLATSSVIRIANIEQLQQTPTAQERDRNPYTFGAVRFTPTNSDLYTRRSTFLAIYWIYGAEADRNGIPDLQVNYAFYRQTAAGEEYVNRTAPEEFSANTLPPQVDAREGIFAIAEIPMSVLEPADYRLEVTVLDRRSDDMIMSDVRFTVQ